MRALCINEGISDLLKPKDIEEISAALNIPKDDPQFWNKVLVRSVKGDQPALIDLSIKNGADQLWWMSGGPMGGHHGLSTDLISELYKITGIKGARGDWRGFHQTTDFKIVFVTVASRKWISQNQYLWEENENLTPSTSQLFYRKYSPVDEHFLYTIKSIKNNADELLKFIETL